MITAPDDVESKLDPLKQGAIFPVIDIEVTLICNHACPNCLKFCGMKNITGLDYSKSFITIEQIHKFIDDVKDIYYRTHKKVAGIIYLTGGEPLLHPKLAEIFVMIKKELCDTDICNGVFINSNLITKIPKELEPYIVNFASIPEKPNIHQAVFYHPSDSGQKPPTYHACTHYRKGTIVYNYMGYNVCCAADGYIRLFNLTELIIDKLPESFEGFPLDKMDLVCQHCIFGCEKKYFEKDLGRPISRIYLDAGQKNKERYL